MTATTLVDVLGEGMTPRDARRWALVVLELADGADDERVHTRQAIGAAVSVRMAEKGVTPEALAPQVGMRVGSLWRRLSGAAEFAAGDLVRIGRALGVETWMLLP